MRRGLDSNLRYLGEEDTRKERYQIGGEDTFRGIRPH